MALDLSLRIELATEKDVLLILTFVRELAEYERLSKYVTADYDKVRAALFGAQPCAEAVIVYRNDQPIGFALFYFNYSTFSGLPGLYLEDIFVRPSSRGAGVGRHLFNYLAKRARERGCGRMEWAVLDWNEAAIRFYQSLSAESVRGWTVFRLSRERIEQLASNSST